MADITLNVAFKINQASYQSVLDSLSAIAEQMQNTVSKSLNIQYNVDTGAFDKINTSLKLLQEIASSCSMSLEKLTKGITVVDTSGITNATTQMQNYADVINSASAGAKKFASSTEQAQSVAKQFSNALGTGNYNKLTEAFKTLDLTVDEKSIRQISDAFSKQGVTITQATAAISELHSYEEQLDDKGIANMVDSTTELVNVTAKGVNSTGELVNATAQWNATAGQINKTQYKVVDNMKQENQLTEEQAQKLAELKAQYSTLSITINSATTDAKSLFKELGGNNATGVDASSVSALFEQMNKLKVVSDELAKAERAAAGATGTEFDEATSKISELSDKVKSTRDQLVQFTNQVNEQLELISKSESLEGQLSLGIGEKDAKYLADLQDAVTKYKQSIEKLNTATQNSLQNPTDPTVALQLTKAIESCEDYKVALSNLTQTTEDYITVSREEFEAEKVAASNEFTARYTALHDSLSTITSDYKSLTTQLRQGVGDNDQAQLDALIAQYQEYQQAILEVQQALKQFSGAKTRDEFDAAIIVTNEAIDSFEKAGDALSVTINTTKEYAEAQKKLAEETKKAEIATRENSELGKSTASTYNELTAVINKNKDASTSSNEAIRDSYNEMKTSAETLNKLRTQYIQTGEGADDLKQAEDRARTSMETFTTTMRTQGSMLGNLIKQFSQFVSVQRIIMYVVRAMRDLINNSIEVNDAMTQLRIVTDETETTYKEFGDTIGKVAQEIGASVTDMIDSVTTYARLGYDIEEATDLAEYTAMLQNVGDIDVEDAQAAITSMVKAFNIDASEIETVMDELVAVGEVMPIRMVTCA